MGGYRTRGGCTRSIHQIWEQWKPRGLHEPRGKNDLAESELSSAFP